MSNKSPCKKAYFVKLDCMEEKIVAVGYNTTQAGARAMIWAENQGHGSKDDPPCVESIELLADIAVIK